MLPDHILSQHVSVVRSLVEGGRDGGLTEEYSDLSAHITADGYAALASRRRALSLGDGTGALDLSLSAWRTLLWHTALHTESSIIG